MPTFLSLLDEAWSPHYWLSMACAMVLGVILTRVTRRGLFFTVQMMVLFVLLIVGSALSTYMGAPRLGNGLSQLAILILGMTLIRQVGFIMFRLVVPRLGMRPPRILEELLILLAYVVWLLLRLSAGGLDLSSLVASTAVVTAVLAFAMQDTLGNILSGLALQLDHSVRIDDWIELEDVAGRVVEVQWRHTAVRTLFGELILIPNSQLMKSRVKLTSGSSAPRRIRSIRFYCEFDMPSALVIAEVERALRQAELPGVARDAGPFCVITDFTDGMLEYAVRYWLTEPKSPGAADSMVRQHLHALFHRKGWRMAAPHRNVLVGTLAEPGGAESHEQEISHRLSVLGGIDLFAALTPEERRDMAERLEQRPYAPGSTITRQGEIGKYLYVLVQGQVDVWLEESGRRNLLAVLDPIQVMGEMSLLTGEPRSATLSARSDVVCYALSKESFQVMLHSRPELADSFAQLLAERSQQRRELRERIHQPEAVQEQQHDIVTRIRGLFGLGRH